MSTQGTACGDRRLKLAVCATDTGETGARPLDDTARWDIVPCETVEEMVSLAQQGVIDAAVLPFDPYDLRSRPSFESLSHHQSNGRPILVSYSRDNPAWIENLVYGAGANLHLHGGLDLQQVTAKLDDLIAVGPRRQGTSARRPSERAGGSRPRQR